MAERWSRGRALASSPPLDTWPTCVTDTMTYAELFQQRVTAMRMYFENSPVDDIECATGVARQSLARMAQRCLGLAPDGRIYGFRALIPHVRTGVYRRTKSTQKSLFSARGGMAGALQKTIEHYPDLEATLVELINKKRGKQTAHEFCISASKLHQVFLSGLEVLDAPKTMWPFNTDYQGQRSIVTYMKDVVARHFSRAVHARENTAARAHLAVGKGYQPILSFNRPFEAVELDAYRIDAITTVAVGTPEGTETDLELARQWLIAAIERASTAIVGWKIVYRNEVTAADVVDVIRQAMTTSFAPGVELTIPGLSYPEATPDYQVALQTYQGALWSTLLLDGALAHLSSQVRESARRVAGYVLNYGAVGHFERRPNVEHTFGRIAEEVFHRLPSTTGSHPQAGRAPDAQAQAIRLRIRADEVEQLAAVNFAQHNVTPSEGLSFLSPIGFLNYFALHDPEQGIVRRLPTTLTVGATSMGQRLICTVRGNIAQGRRPYVQLDRALYTNPALASAGHLIGTKLIIDIFNDDDYRAVRAYLENGAELGVLQVQGRWRLTPHSRKTRQAINSLLSKRLLVVSALDDPVQVYLRYLGTPRKRAKKSEPPLSPKEATALTRIAAEADVTPQLYPPPTTPTDSPAPVAAPKRSLIDKPLPDFSRFQNRR